MATQLVEVLDIESMQVHRLATTHRSMSEQEYRSLTLSIQDNGQLIPVTLYKGKIVDGRHRLNALIDLGETTINAIKLNNNLTLEEVKQKVQGTEMRRSDNVMQRAIRAYKDMLEGNSSTQEEASIKFAVSQTEVSRAKKVHERLGLEFLNRLYELGHVMLDGKRLTQLRVILKYYEVKPVKDRDYEAPSEEVANIYSKLKLMLEDGSTEELALVATRAKKYIIKLTE